MQRATKMTPVVYKRITKAAVETSVSNTNMQAWIGEHSYGFFLGPWCRALSQGFRRMAGPPDGLGGRGEFSLVPGMSECYDATKGGGIR